jgi:hypothetical protein
MQPWRQHPGTHQGPYYNGERGLNQGSKLVTFGLKSNHNSPLQPTHIGVEGALTPLSQAHPHQHSHWRLDWTRLWQSDELDWTRLWWAGTDYHGKTRVFDSSRISHGCFCTQLATPALKSVTDSELQFNLIWCSSWALGEGTRREELWTKLQLMQL